MKSVTEQLINFINASPTPHHATENAANILTENGFRLININAKDAVIPSKFFFSRSGFTQSLGTSLIAVSLPKDANGKAVTPKGMHVCAAHTDSPCFRIKPNAVMESGSYCRLNSERYGGGIWSSWLDRPLAVAGRVYIASNGDTIAKNVVIPGNIVIPNVAIHQNRQINDGYTYSANVDLVPLLGDKESGKAFTERLCSAAGCTEDELLDYDLSIYNPQSGFIWGGNGEFISAPRLDDLQCVFNALLGFISADTPREYASVLALFDCEEVGSSCISGANSDLLRITASLIAESTNTTVDSLTGNGFLLSADNGHAVHPNHPEFTDPTNRPVMGGGIVLKYKSSKRYITDGESGAYVRQLCKKNEIPLQTFANRSDMPGGSTLGNISGTQLPLPGADIGLAQLSMHSSFETAGSADNEAMVSLTRAFFSL